MRFTRTGIRSNSSRKQMLIPMLHQISFELFGIGLLNSENVRSELEREVIIDSLRFHIVFLREFSSICNQLGKQHDRKRVK